MDVGAAMHACFRKDLQCDADVFAWEGDSAVEDNMRHLLQAKGIFPQGKATDVDVKMVLSPGSRRFYDVYEAGFKEFRETDKEGAWVADLMQNPGKRSIHGTVMPAFTTKTQRYSFSKARFFTAAEL
eukprot:9252848-Alexandrium_andersonii.AAC.1